MKKILSLFALVLISCMGAWAQGTVSGAQGTIYTSPAMEDGDFVSGTKFYTIEIGRNNCQLDSRYLPTVRNKKAAACDQNKWAVFAKGDGYQLINKATKKALTFAGTANDDKSSLTDNFEDANSVFEFTTTQNSIFASGYEVFRIAGTTEAYPNDKESQGLAIWTSAQALWGWQGSSASPKNGDDGSKFKFSMVEELVTTTYTINVVGAPSDVVVTVEGAIKAVGEAFTLNHSVIASAVSSTAFDFYDYTVDVEGGVITITYTPWPDYTYNRAFVGVAHTRTARQISSIKLGDQEETINGAGNIYQDLTSSITFRIEAGEVVKPAVIWNGAWMHGYVFVDTNSADKQFTTEELVASAGMPSPERSVDLATEFNGFKIDNPGTYRMRYMVAWNSTDPMGPNTIVADGGYILDMLLEVVGAADKANVTYKYVVDGKEVKTITNEQTIGEHAAAQPLAINATYADVTDDHAEKTVAADGSTVVTVTVAQHLPFQAWDKNGLFPPMGLLHVHSNQGRFLYAEYDADFNGKLWDTTDQIYRGDFYEEGRFYYWAITGNVIEGFQLYEPMVGQYVNVTANNQATLSETEGTIFDLRPTTAGVGGRNFKNGFCLAIAGSNNFLNAQTKIQDGERTTGVKTWTSADAGSTFEFEYTYDFTISDAGYATLFYHTPLLIPEEVKAYSVVREGDYLVATELQDGFVPSATGVILKGAAGDYTATVTGEYGNAAIENNVLSGRYVNGTDGINDNTYVLKVVGEDAYFAKFIGSQLGEFKAYYQAPAESASNLRISFGELNSIISAAQENGGQAIFDLQGRRVVSAKGLYIVNGKKVIK